MDFLDFIHVQISQVVDFKKEKKKKISVSDKTGVTGYVTHTHRESARDRRAATLSALFRDVRAF